MQRQGLVSVVVTAAQRLVVIGMVILNVLDVAVRHRFFHLLGTNLNGHQQPRHFHANAVEQPLEQLEGLALVFLFRVFLRIAAQMDALTQVIERRQVLAPLRVE